MHIPTVPPGPRHGAGRARRMGAGDSTASSRCACWLWWRRGRGSRAPHPSSSFHTAPPRSRLTGGCTGRASWHPRRGRGGRASWPLDCCRRNRRGHGWAWEAATICSNNAAPSGGRCRGGSRRPRGRPMRTSMAWRPMGALDSSWDWRWHRWFTQPTAAVCRGSRGHAWRKDFRRSKRGRRGWAPSWPRWRWRWACKQEGAAGGKGAGGER